jgi:hypothetical protein
MYTGSTRLSRFATLVFWFVGLNALAGAGSLILFPGATEWLFFWPIAPKLNAGLFGALYLGGGVVVCLLARRRLWEPARFLIPVLVSAGTMIALITLLHRDRFTPGIYLAYWLLVYIGAPLLALVIYWQHERDGRASWAISAPLAPATRWLAVGTGALQLAAGLLIIAWPAPVIALWPWPMSPLMLRVFAAWFGAFGVGLLWFQVDPDWERLHMLASLLLAAAVLDGAMLFIHRSDLTTGGPALWLYGAHLLWLGLLGALLHGLQSRSWPALRPRAL